jgi:trehalose 6-phosphate phosphatase
MDLEERVVAAARSDPLRVLVAVDFDGTLAPIVERPEDARPVPGAVDVLTGLAARIGQLALISGRGAEEVVGLAGVGEIHGILVLGHYGLQQWREGRLSSPDPDPGIATARRRLPELLANAAEGVYVEDKVHSLAVHSRPAREPQRALDDLAPALRDLATQTGLEAVPGRYVLELRPPGVDKGTALRRLIDEVRPAVVVYAGDDLGDLPAVRVVRELRESGVLDGLSIAVVPPVATDTPAELSEQVDLVVPGQAALVSWLRNIMPAD